MSSSEKECDALTKEITTKGGFTKREIPAAPSFTEEEQKELRNVKGPNTMPDFMVKYIKDYLGDEDYLKGKSDYEIKKIMWFEVLKDRCIRKYRICA